MMAVAPVSRGSVTDQIRHLLKVGMESDCTFLVGSGSEAEEFLCHRLPLTRGSAVLCAMLQAGQPGAVLRIADLQPANFLYLMEFMYTGSIALTSVEMALTVWTVAHKYQVIPLVAMTLEYIKSELSPELVCMALQFAQVVGPCELLDFCVQCLQSWTDTIVCADSWVDADLMTVITLLKQDTLNIDSELSLLSACLRWGQHRTHDTSGLRLLLDQVLRLIRLRTLTTEEFTNYIMPLSVFSDTEKLHIIVCIVNHAHVMPEGFCTATKPRMNAAGFHNLATPKARVISRLSLDELRIDYRTLGTRSRMQCYLDLTPSEDVLVYGIQIQALDVTQVSCIHADSYEEKVNVLIVKERDVMICTEFKGFVTYGSKYKVFFHEPCLIPKNSQFYFRTNYENTENKYYANFTYMGHECSVPGVNFRFHPNTNQESHITCVYFKRQRDV